MEASFWDVLGIAETTDERAIKRAFATRLRITSPESDAAGYMKLRDAFEAAKHHVAMQRYLAASPETPADEPLEVVDVQPAPPAIEETPATPQQQIYADLQVLLSEQRFDDFLRKIEDVQASQIFATLDEQQDFIGEIALLVQNAEIEDSSWRGRLASLLGAREHDNIFSRDSECWYAYESLLESYAELRATAAHAHAYTEDQDDVAVTPGYLHVYHVLTAPFDSERLSALTRSRTYHRLAERILERSRVDSSVAIPAENREWWERTAMTGQHRPMEEPVVTTNPPPADESSKFPFFWVIWLVAVLLFNAIRTFDDESPSRNARSEQMQRYQELMPATESPLFRRMARCDPQTRVEIYFATSRG